MSLIEIQDICKIYGEGENAVHALDGVSLSIDYGEFVAIIGASGSGKSTMMNILGCLDVPTGGEYLLDGISIRERTQRELADIRSRRIGFVFQGYNLIPSLKVWENVALPLSYQKVPPKERFRRAMEALERVEIAEKAESRPGQLSGGQQQRVAICRALAMEPEVLLLDEVTAALDPEMVHEVLQVVLELADDGLTMLIVTHEMSFAQAIADRVVMLDAGHIVEEGGPEFFACPKTERARAFLRTFEFHRSGRKA